MKDPEMLNRNLVSSPILKGKSKMDHFLESRKIPGPK